MDILLVEDNISSAWIMKSILERAGHTVWTAKTGKEAITLSFREFNVILLDVGLPDMTGLDVARVIREKERCRNLIIGISSLGNSIREQCLNAGFNNVYDKPLTEIEIDIILREIEPHGKKRIFNTAGSSVTTRHM